MQLSTRQLYPPWGSFEIVSSSTYFQNISFYSTFCGLCIEKTKQTKTRSSKSGSDPPCSFQGNLYSVSQVKASSRAHIYKEARETPRRPVRIPRPGPQSHGIQPARVLDLTPQHINIPGPRGPRPCGEFWASDLFVCLVCIACYITNLWMALLMNAGTDRDLEETGRVEYKTRSLGRYSGSGSRMLGFLPIAVV